ncbi:MAG: hypothetical protein ABEI52_01470, partial [Halobacteriaceae archaeon]
TSINSSPAIADIDEDGMNEVVFGTEDGRITALNHLGEVMWSVDVPGSIRATPLLHDIDDDTLSETIVGDTSGSLYIIGARGEVKQEIELDAGIEATPAILDETFIIGCHDGTIRRMDGEDELWRYATRDTIVAPIVVTDLYRNEDQTILAG